MLLRPSARKAFEKRPTTLEMGCSPYAEGSVFIRMGGTHVYCTASVENRVPPFLRNTGKGWVTAEYGMLPRATHDRMDREAARGKQSGRTQEIQRLIGRSLRAVVDFQSLGERQIKIDCDVIQADGGTRTAAITGSYVALAQALHTLMKEGKITKWPLSDHLAAISCGVFKDTCILDLDYQEDHQAQADANFVLSATGKIIEIQVTAEEAPLSQEHFSEMLSLAQKGIQELVDLQKKTLKKLVETITLSF